MRDLMPTTPFIAGLGVVIERYDPDEVTLRLPFRADLTNDGAYYHGGVIASAIDTAGACAAWSNHDFDKGARASVSRRRMSPAWSATERTAGSPRAAFEDCP